MDVVLSKTQLGFFPGSGTNLFCDQKKAWSHVCLCEILFLRAAVLPFLLGKN